MSRFPGNIIKLPNVTPTQSSASGVWSLKDQMVYQRNNLWPFQRDPYFNYTTLLLQGNVPNTTGPQAMNLPLSYNADASTNNFLVTPNGDVGPRPFSPYFGGNYSVYFDGATSTRLTLASSSDFAFGTGAYTIEAWVYLAAYASNGNVIFDTGNASSSLYFTVGSSGALAIGKQGTGYLITSANSVVALNTWVHVAISRSSTSSNDTRLFVNGVFVAVGTDSNNWTVTTTPTIGGINASGYTTTGYISNLSVLKGTAKYTTNFTPTAQALPTGTTNQVLLACASNRFIDTNTATTAKAITVNGDSRITDNSPFVSTDFTTGAGYFNGTTSYLSVPSSTAFGYGTGDFTIECWVYPLASTAQRLVFGGGDLNNLDIGFNPANTFQYYDGTVRDTGVSAASRQWFHFAVSRTSGTTSVYINGTRTNNFPDTSNSSARQYFVAGSNVGGNPFNGYINDVRIIKGQGIYSGTTITIPNAPLTTTGYGNTSQNITGTISLLTLQTRAPSQNINFIDSSPNEFIVTKNGNTTQGTFSPFSPTGWGNYFNGSTDYLSLSDNAAWNMGSGDFTAECWIYPTSFANQGMILGQWSGDVGGTGLNWALMFDSGGSGYLRFLTSSNGSGVLFDLSTSTTSFTLTLNTWQHIAGVRNGNTFTIYVNGVSRATTTSASSLYDATNNFTIGAESSTTAQYFTGYISNIRLIKGQALATGNFTPPTALASSTVVGWTGTNVPTQSITGTVSLLTCQSNRFVDNGPNNFTITRNGSPSVQAFSPFAPANAVSPLVTGGSGYFDGTGDYLQVAANTNLNFGTGNFTVEAWVYTASTGTLYFVIGDSTGDGFFGYESGNFTLGRRGIANDVSTSGFTMPQNQWTHVAFTRAGTSTNQTRIFVNGVLRGIGTTSQSYNFPTNISIVGGTFGSWPGYFTNLRLVKGTVVSAYSTSSTTVGDVIFSPPTAPLTAITDTSLLLNFTNGAAVDATGKNNLESVGNAQNSGVQAKWNYLTGGSSMYFDATDDRLSNNNAANPLYAFRTGDFTIEAWVYPLVNTGERGWFQTSDTAGGLKTSYPTGVCIFTSPTPNAYWLAQVGSTAISTTTSVATNTWTHIAITRASGSVRMFVNGNLAAGPTSATGDLTGQYICVGGYYSTTYLWNGYLSNVRVTNYARYTAAFNTNLPTGPFPIG